MDTTFDYLQKRRPRCQRRIQSKRGNRARGGNSRTIADAVEAEAETNVPNEEEEEENESDTISELRAMLEADEIGKDDFDEALAELKGDAPTPAQEPEKLSNAEEAVKKETATSGKSEVNAAPQQANAKTKSNQSIRPKHLLQTKRSI